MFPVVGLDGLPIAAQRLVAPAEQLVRAGAQLEGLGVVGVVEPACGRRPRRPIVYRMQKNWKLLWIFG